MSKKEEKRKEISSFTDKRYYTRYKIRLEGRIAGEKGYAFSVEVLDVSAEGARLKTFSQVPFVEEDKVNLVIKWKTSIKAGAEVSWIKNESLFTEFGIRFTEIDMANRQTLSSLISEFALASLHDVYTR